MKSGLVSITFRKLSPGEIIRRCADAGLECIEWGGDVHVPHGNLERAREVRDATRDAGLSVSAYGSYFRLGMQHDFSMEQVVETAAELGAPLIRVWAGRIDSVDATPEIWAAVVAEALRMADLAAAHGIHIAYESHGNTLTDTLPSTLRLLKETEHPNIRTLWQPPVGMEPSHCLEWLRQVLPKLANLHVFHWWPTGFDRNPLADGEAAWRKYFEMVRSAGLSPDALLEFLPEDDPELLSREAATLRHLLTEA